MARLVVAEFILCSILPISGCKLETLDSGVKTPALIPPPAGSPGLANHKLPLGQEIVAPGTLYSPGVLVGNTLYVAGLQGTDATTHKLPPDFDKEVKNCLDNIGAVLKDGGMGYEDVVSVQIYLADITQFQRVNDIYKTYFKGVLPARTTVQVAKLSLGSRIELAAVAQK
jgi:2-iminobutanoate/2-iminopropanoate deaminase